MDSIQDTIKRNFYRKIQLAAAVFVVKSTPINKTPEAHATDLQNQLRALWLNSNFPVDTNSPSFQSNRLILAQHQKALVSRLYAVASHSSSKRTNDSASEFQCFVNAGHNPSHFEEYLNNLQKNRKSLQDNAKFIHAIFQLKALAEAQSTIPMENYISFVSNLAVSEHLAPFSSGECSIPPHSEPFSSSEDSGFHTVSEDRLTKLNAPDFSNAGNEEPVTGVASSVLLYILNSCSVDQLIFKSTQIILNQLKEFAYYNETVWAISNLDDKMNHWMGSIHQQAVKVLHSVVWNHDRKADSNTNSGYQDCFAFLQEMILKVLETKSFSQDDCCIKENQILLILQISEGTSLWSQALEIVISKTVEFFSHFEKFEKDSRHREIEETMLDQRNFSTNWENVEESYFLFDLLKLFLKSAKPHMALMSQRKESLSPKMCTMQEHNVPSSKSHSITELWRRHYNVQMSNHTKALGLQDTPQDRKSKLTSWKHSLDDIFAHIPQKFSLLSVSVAECIYEVDHLKCQDYFDDSLI